MTTLQHAPTTTRPAGTGVSRFAGAAFLVLFTTGFVIWSLPPYVYEGSTLAEYAEAHADTGRITLLSIAAFIVWPLAGACLLWVVTRVRRLLDAALGTASVPGQLAVLGAVVVAAGFTVAAAAASAGAHVATGSIDGGFPADPAAGYPLDMLSGQLFTASLWGAALLLVAIGVAARRTGQLPGWLVWTGFVIAPLLPIAWVFFMLPLMVFVVWVAAVGAVMKTGQVTPG
jgi:hypothetical protein